MEKLLMIFVVLLLFTACSKNTAMKNTPLEPVEATYDYTDQIDKNQVEQHIAEGDFIYDITDPSLIKDNSTHVFIAKVKSIDSATCSPYGPSSYQSIPFTIGKLEIIQNLVGETEDIINFSRVGGTVSLEEYDRNASPETLEKRQFLRNQSNETPKNYIHAVFKDDIDLEAGQTYIFYALYVTENNEYAIQGFQYGTREIDNFQANTRSSQSDATILNNVTGEKESLDDYLQTYFH